MSENEQTAVYNKLFRELINSADSRGDAEWATEKQTVSTNVRNAIVEKLKELKNSYNDKFMDYCNSVKALLAVYNFGALAGEESLLASGDAESSELKACRDRTESDKKLIKTGIKNILAHVREHGYDITPYISPNDNATIFGEDDETSADYKKIVGKNMITLSATTVMTTLIYFRRAVKRMSLFTSAELIDGATNLTEEIAQTLAGIMYEFTRRAQKNGYKGWGLTMSSRAITLNDTYSVVDAISRFADAFMSDKKDKSDEEFVKLVDSYTPVEDDWASDEKKLTDRCNAAMYKVAYNIYAMTKNVFGQSIFYFNAERTVDNKIVYNTSKTTYDQIASSNRSSALFNPLYVAMITMYGYNEKEIVIRRFMDDRDLAKQYFDDYQEKRADDMMLISEYAVKELKAFDSEEEFLDAAKKLTEPHEPVSNSYGQGIWGDYYRVARVFQKYLETQLPDELMKLDEYRDYLNATKDAIDQVQVAYRNFDNAQRLGIVDTDYIMFSALDVDTAPANISTLNKKNISVNNLRPILLSSKIMIVNALVKYPQSDMSDLYTAIKASRHRRDTTVKKSSARADASDTEWLWNEDDVDMNSTARHCEAIMYDYFDYYERYELGFKAMKNLKDRINELVAFNDDGSLKYDDSKIESFGKIVFELSKTNIDRAKVAYSRNLAAKDEEIAKLQKKLDEQSAKAEERYKELENKHRAELAELETTINIGNTLRGWIRSETEMYLKDTLSYMILNNLNGYLDKSLSVRKLLSPDETMADGNFDYAHELAEKIMADYRKNNDAAEHEYTDKFRAARKMQRLFDGALDGLLLKNDISHIYEDDKKTLEVRNRDIYDAYAQQKKARRTETVAEPSADETADGDSQN